MAAMHWSVVYILRLFYSISATLLTLGTSSIYYIHNMRVEPGQETWEESSTTLDLKYKASTLYDFDPRPTKCRQRFTQWIVLDQYVYGKKFKCQEVQTTTDVKHFHYDDFEIDPDNENKKFSAYVLIPYTF